MKVYLDSEYRCHVENAPGYIPMETEYFDGKCRQFIEGYRLVPEGETWTREDGVVFHGAMLCPCLNHEALEASQRQYESLMPQIDELEQKLQRLWDCLDGLASVPGLEQLQDFLLSIREIMEDE